MMCCKPCLAADITVLPPNLQDHFHVTLRFIKQLGIERNVQITYMSLSLPIYPYK
jgi:hypothetical protein